MKNVGTVFTSAIQIPLFMFFFAAVMTMLYLFPVYVHYELKLIQIIKNSFLMMLIHPLENLVMLAGMVAMFFVVKFVPGLGFFFGGSLSAALIMASGYLVFNKVDKKRNR